MADKLISQLGSGPVLVTDVVEHEPLAGPPSLKATVTALFSDAASRLAINRDNRILVDSQVIGVNSVDWDNRQLFDTSGIPVFGWATFQLADGSGIASLNWSSRELIDAAGDVSVNYTSRTLHYSNLATLALDWNGGLGFFGTAAITKPTVSGARDDPESALANLLTALANLGLITDTTTPT